MKVNPKCPIRRSLLAGKSGAAPRGLRAAPEQPLPDRAALLHHLGPVEPGQFAEPVVAVDHGPLHDLGVAYQEAGLWRTGDRSDQSLHRNPGTGWTLGPTSSLEPSEDAGGAHLNRM